MLGALAKYIFGGIMGDAPDTTAPEMQYQTREVNDWLLVDMPDQAIDDEDMDSESDDDEILTALPLLMAEETTEIMQSCEEIKDYSICDNSFDKIQHLDDKIRCVPSAVQHNSGDKIQGNFVDTVEAVSVTSAEDNFHDKIQDISVDVKENSNDITQDTSVQIQGNSRVVQENFENKFPEDFEYKIQSVSLEVQDSSHDKIIFVDEVESVSSEIQEHFNRIHDNLDAETCNNVEIQGNINDVQENFDDKSNFSKVRKNSYDKINNYIKEITHFTIGNNLYESSPVKEYLLDIVENEFELGKLNDHYAENCDEVQENSNQIIQGNFAKLETLHEQNVGNCNEDVQGNSGIFQNKFRCERRKILAYYSEKIEKPIRQTLKKCGINSDEMYSSNSFRRIFGNEISEDEMDESSDDENQETSDDEMNENSDDEVNSNGKMNENSNVEIQKNYTDGTKEKSYDIVIPLSSDEESEEEYSEDEFPELCDEFAQYFRFLPSKYKYKAEPYVNGMKRDGFPSEQVLHELRKRVPQVSNHQVGCIQDTKYEHTADFEVVSQCWNAYQTWYYPSSYALAITELYSSPISYATRGRCPQLERIKPITKTLKEERLLKNKSSASTATEPSVITTSAEILQNLINQKSTVLPTKTAVVLEHIKELKPVQQAIQFENRKYLTRSQLNRQNRNYMYQSSVKTNRRRNLQRNHSGANNNRKC